MQFPITIGLRRSRFLDIALLLVAFLASLAVLCLPQATVIQFVICAAIWIIAGLTWWYLTPYFSAIRLEHSGQMSVAIDDKTDFLPAEIFPGATVHLWITVVKLKTDNGRSRPLIATVDSLNKQNFRRLRVFLRWQAKLSSPSDDA